MVRHGPAGGGTCSSSSGNEADIIYNSASNVLQYCNGSYWATFGK
jgi:hypothetical protein